MEDGKWNLIGVYREKIALMKAKFDIENADGTKLCRLSGSVVGRKFKFGTDDGQTIAGINQ